MKEQQQQQQQQQQPYTERDPYIQQTLICKSYIFGHLTLLGHLGRSGAQVTLQLGERQGYVYSRTHSKGHIDLSIKR
jgi:hypothetical protein